MEVAIRNSHIGVFFNQGQVCCAGTRLFVEESVYDDFVEKSVVMVSKRKVGNPFNYDTEQGPQVSTLIQAHIFLTSVRNHW